ncbi:acyl-CoA N-acyltransferase [Crucibulum laeve]|uniref:N-alpha-acetyltransferase 60 n=1 Tax=Crucibulum laeve TaxID=68775 RepID=A0A5C3MGF6_9AGAR|nr:acyl-CoA N-acyltransferase [Crucibulum laeve]
MPASTSLPLNDIIVRPLTSADVPKVIELHAHVLPIRYSRSFFLQLLVLPSRACLVAHKRTQPNNLIAFVSAAMQQPLAVYNHHLIEVQEPTPGAIAGSPTKSFVHIDPTRPRLEILTLGVLPQYQHLGLARRLIQCVTQKLLGLKPMPIADQTIIYANVSTSNEPALKFYESMGMDLEMHI